MCVWGGGCHTSSCQLPCLLASGQLFLPMKPWTYCTMPFIWTARGGLRYGLSCQVYWGGEVGKRGRQGVSSGREREGREETVVVTIRVQFCVQQQTLHLEMRVTCLIHGDHNVTSLSPLASWQLYPLPPRLFLFFCY